MDLLHIILCATRGYKYQSGYGSFVINTEDKMVYRKYFYISALLFMYVHVIVNGIKLK